MGKGARMYLHPYHNLSDHDFGLLTFVIVPAVLLLCWLFNAKKLGKFKKKAHAPKTSIGQNSRAKRFLLLFLGILCGILLGLAIRLL